jgi:ubiquinone biosynthesis protein Coq4
MADMVRRNAETFPGWAAPDTVPEMQPYRGQTPEDRALGERFRGLEALPGDTFGHAFWRHFRRHGFAFPGEPTAFAGAFAVPHDGLHVLSGYSTSLQGELLVSTFTGAMHGHDGLRAHLLPVIFQWHVGAEVNGIGAQRGALDPEKLLVAWERGEATTGDVLSSQWDFWSVAPRPLDELRAEYGITPLDPAEAASGPEITVAADADPDAV